MYYYMWDTCTSHFGVKKIDRVGRGGSGMVKILPRMGLAFGFGALKRPLNGSRTPEMDSNQSGVVGGITWVYFRGPARDDILHAEKKRAQVGMAIRMKRIILQLHGLSRNPSASKV